MGDPLESNCPVCGCEWGEARLWRCGHSVCLDCHQRKIREADTASNRRVTCNRCDTRVSVAALRRSPPNFPLQALLVNVRAFQTALVLARARLDTLLTPTQVPSADSHTFSDNSQADTEVVNANLVRVLRDRVAALEAEIAARHAADIAAAAATAPLAPLHPVMSDADWGVGAIETRQPIYNQFL